jgi:hypothetical protein
LIFRASRGSRTFRSSTTNQSKFHPGIPEQTYDFSDTGQTNKKKNQTSSIHASKKNRKTHDTHLPAVACIIIFPFLSPKVLEKWDL